MRSKLREALVLVIVELRPSWDADGIRKALEHPDLASVNENAVTLAAVRAATDGKVRSPGVIPSPGPHWDERPANAPTPIPPRFAAAAPLSDAERAAADQAAARAREALAAARSVVESVEVSQ
ncbi:MAG TPA: hypothetical protein VIJ31_04035 [Acidothermaceae bacterium]